MSEENYFDATAALAYFGEHEVLVESLHFLLAEVLVDDIEQISTALDNSNRLFWKSLAHKMKSTALYAAAEPLARSCSYLEEQADFLSEDALIEAAKSLLQVSRKTQAAIQTWLTTCPEASLS
ncbi:MAG: Hpt domain-containing protein [Legionellaceae bacterium]|nr:Hpt domain-containing protein [Legionellaceae bacterium]